MEAGGCAALWAETWRLIAWVGAGARDLMWHRYPVMGTGTAESRQTHLTEGP